ncbi:hypothetical protein I2486_18700 [Cellulophaga sp. E16_2]|uniref:hypothetical protein n=1 Tax=Cellulophaga sp. E16_2 TaxID=2789297 RepID=UPI001A937E84|nr:hypothetical protein [Cellulophaga sp. E16_2]MBO0593432.1 hypothetical protein [Cellulophaga sp. E16_2]
MKPSFTYLEKGRNTILNLGYGLIELKSRSKNFLIKRASLFFHKNSNNQGVVSSSALEDNKISS